MDFLFAPLGGAMHIFALVALFLFTGAAVYGLLYLAALPGKIAARRNHPQAAAVNICGWLGLPTGGFWLIALVWAFWNYRTDASADRKLIELVSQLEQTIAKLEEQRTGGAA